MIRNLLANVCDPASCPEKGQVVWGQRPTIHIRVDGGFIKSVKVKKNDCLLLCDAGLSARTFVMFVEVKRRSYNLREVVEQLQNGLDAFSKAMAQLTSAFENPTVICPMLPPNMRTHGRATHIARLLTNIRRNRFEIVPVLCANAKTRKILEKNGLHRRVALSSAFRIRTRQGSTPIIFVESGGSLWDVVKSH